MVEVLLDFMLFIVSRVVRRDICCWAIKSFSCLPPSCVLNTTKPTSMRPPQPRRWRSWWPAMKIVGVRGSGRTTRETVWGELRSIISMHTHTYNQSMRRYHTELRKICLYSVWPGISYQLVCCAVYCERRWCRRNPDIFLGVWSNSVQSRVWKHNNKKKQCMWTFLNAYRGGFVSFTHFINYKTFKLSSVSQLTN